MLFGMSGAIILTIMSIYRGILGEIYVETAHFILLEYSTLALSFAAQCHVDARELHRQMMVCFRREKHLSSLAREFREFAMDYFGLKE